MTDLTFSAPMVWGDAYAHHGRNIIMKHLEGRMPDAGLPPPPVFKQAATPPGVVGILGAGVGGLYTALILQDLNIPFQLIEARERVGGRLFTHKFENDTGAPYNYYDVGAMRFPQIPSMERVFKLFDYPPLNQGDKTLKSKLTPFLFANNNTFFDYNGVTVRRSAVPSADPFKADQVLDSPEKQAYIKTGAAKIADDVIRPFATALLDDLKNGTNEGWKKLMEKDTHSTRSYMGFAYEPSAQLNLPKGPLPGDVINWVETFDKSTGWYDRSLSETVLEAIAFGWQPDSARPTDWFCIDGGSFEIARYMKDYIVGKAGSKSIVYNSTVTSIELNDKNDGMKVLVKGAKPYEFSHVVSTIPLP
ncbi:hypothetical protein FRC11_010240, partial [Ceratobasidium sp. 423]